MGVGEGSDVAPTGLHMSPRSCGGCPAHAVLQVLTWGPRVALNPRTDSLGPAIPLPAVLSA